MYGCRTSAIVGSFISTIGLVSSFFVTTIYQLYLTYGVLLGMGFGLMYISGSVSICRHFIKKRTLAYSIACCGSGVGTFMFTPFCMWLLETLGLRGTFLIFAGVSLNGTVLALFYPPIIKSTISKDVCKETNTQTVESIINKDINSVSKSISMSKNVNAQDSETVKIKMHVKESNNSSFAISFKQKLFNMKHWLTNPYLILLMVSLFLCGIQAFLPFILLPDYGLMIGYSKDQSSWFVSALGIAATIGRIVTGLIADLLTVNRPVFQGVIIIFAGLFTAVVPWLSSYPVIMTYSIVYGLVSGGIMILQPMVLLDYFGEDEDCITEVMGTYMFVVGLGTLIGPPLAGWLFDVTEAYTLTFTVASGLSLISGIIALLVMCLNGRKRT